MPILSATLVTILLATASSPANTEPSAAATTSVLRPTLQSPARVAALQPEIRARLLKIQRTFPQPARPRLDAARSCYETKVQSGKGGAADSLARPCVRRHFPSATSSDVELLSALLLFEHGEREREAIDKLGADLQRSRDLTRTLQAEIRLMEEVRKERGLVWQPIERSRVTRVETAQRYSREQLRQMSVTQFQRTYDALHERQREAALSSNMFYLGLQQKMQDEVRRFSLVSNIMKTKHDTSLNSIANVR